MRYTTSSLRYISILCIILGLHSTLCSQNGCRQELEELRILTQQKSFPEAKNLASKILDCLAEQNKPDSVTWLETHYLLGYTYRNTYQNDSSIYHNDLALRAAKSLLPTTHLLYLKSLHQEGILAYLNDDNPAAKIIYDQVDSLYKLTSQDDFSLSFELFLNYANYYSEVMEWDKAAAQCDAGIRLCEKENTPYANERVGVLYTLYGSISSDSGDLLTSRDFHQQAAEIFARYNDDSHPDAAAVYNNLASSHLRLNNDLQALQALQKAYAAFLLHNPPDKPPVGVILNNMGNAYHRLGDINKAIELFENVLAIRSTHYGAQHIRTALAKLHLASMYTELDEAEKTIPLIQESMLVIADIASEHHPLLSQCNSNLAIAYRTLGDYANAERCYDAAYRILAHNYSFSHPSFLRLFRNRAQLHQLQGEQEAALEWINKALLAAKETTGDYSSEAAINYGTLGHILAKEGETIAAIEAFERAFEHLQLDPADEINYQQIEDRMALLKILTNLVNCYWTQYEQRGKTAALDAIIHHAKQAIGLLDYQRQQAQAVADKELFVHKNYQLYESIVSASLLKQENENNTSHLAEAVNYIERSKSNVLLDAMRQSGPTAFGILPKELLQTGQQLKVDINYLEKKLFQKDLQEQEQQALQNQLFTLRRSLQTHEEQLAANYPAYFALTQRDQWESPASVATHLADDTALLEYFLGDKIIAVFGQTKGQSFHWWASLPEGFHAQLEGLLANWKQAPGLEQEELEKGLNHFRLQSHAIYQLIFEPLEAWLSPAISRLIIIPDGQLAYLPFGLLVSTPTEATSFRDLPYLIKKYSFSYAPSVTVWQEMKSKTVVRRTSLVVAPDFVPVVYDTIWSGLAEARRNDLGPLHFNQREGQFIHELCQGTALLGKHASLANFQQQYASADIFHFATHAKIEEIANRYSFLAFANAQEQPDSARLYLADLYNMQLPANMVVLSACETGLGKLRRGEGLLSLARGFTYAGAKSIITSLWSVNDLATAQIMEQFYTQLDQGDSKDIALRQAKLTYLQQQTTDRNSHPYYWAAFIALGDMEAIELQPKSWFWRWGWWVVGLVGLMIIGIKYKNR